MASLSSFRSISADEVYVNVSIAEETTGAWIEGVKVSYINRAENLNLTYDTGEIRVYVTGPRSVIEDLQENGFAATVDLSGLTAGVYSLAPTFPVDTYPDVTFTPEPGEVEATLTEAKEGRGRISAQQEETNDAQRDIPTRSSTRCSDG